MTQTMENKTVKPSAETSRNEAGKPSDKWPQAYEIVQVSGNLTKMLAACGSLSNVRSM